MANSAGRVGSGNQGQTDMDRGSGKTFPYSKGQRNTGKLSNGGSTSNPNDKPGLSKSVRDPRLA
jgi:hypothetical protein